MHSCLYYTNSEICAKQYAAWAARRSGSEPGSEPAILHVYVSKPWLQSLRTVGDMRYLTTPEFQDLLGTAISRQPLFLMNQNL